MTQQVFITSRSLQSLLAVFFLLLSVVASAQGNATFPKENVSKRMERIQKHSKVTIAFDAASVNNLSAPRLATKGKSVENLLAASLQATPLTYKKTSNNTYVIVNKTIAPKNNKPGRIAGKIVDDRGDALIGATIKIFAPNQPEQLVKGTVTGLNGDFILDLPAGEYIAEISYIGYSTKKITDVTVEPGKLGRLNAVLATSSTELGDVVVTGNYKRSTTAAVLQIQKNAAQLSNSISIEQISQSPDNNLADALKRVSGVTIINKKFVAVRGTGERWSEAALDGISLPSSESTTKAFSFDLIPTSLIDNIVVSKTLTPDMNASFAGGYIQITTKDIPEKNFLSLSAGASWNNQSTFKNQFHKKRRKYDYLGFDDGKRDLPKGLVSRRVLDLYENPDGSGLNGIRYNPKTYEQSKLPDFLNDNLTTYQSKTPLSQNYQVAWGHLFPLQNNQRLGLIASLSYRNTQKQTDIKQITRGSWGIEHNRYDENGTPDYTNQGAKYGFNTTWGGLLNLGLQTGKSRFSLRNTYTRVFTSDLTQIIGWDKSSYQTEDNKDTPAIQETNYPIFQSLLQNKIGGQHQLGKLKLEWDLAHTRIQRDQKDVTFTTHGKTKIGGELVRIGESSTIGNSSDRFSGGGRATYLNNETDWNWQCSLEFPVQLGNLRSLIKAGYFGIDKHNKYEYSEYNLSHFEKSITDPTPSTPDSIRYLSFAQKLNPELYHPQGLAWIPRLAHGRYEGESRQHAPFLMFDHRLGKQWRLVWGMRAEYYKYTEDENFQASTTTQHQWVFKKDKRWEFNPSANLSFSPTDKINLRLAAGRSVLRPQFLEQVKFDFFDPLEGAKLYSGGVSSSRINNFDFKIEFFPDLDETIAAGIFYRDIKDPLERIKYGSAGNYIIVMQNSSRAKIKGLEIDFRKKLGFVSPLLKNIVLHGNATFTSTNVHMYENKKDENGDDIDWEFESIDAKRPLYGESPYIYNLGLGYEGERLGMNTLYHKTGRKTYTLATLGGWHLQEWQAPYAQLDAQLSYKFLPGKNLKLKANFGNLLNEAVLFYNNINSVTTESLNLKDSRKLVYKPGFSEDYDKEDIITYKFFTGRNVSLSVTYEF